MSDLWDSFKSSGILGNILSATPGIIGIFYTYYLDSQKRPEISLERQVEFRPGRGNMIANILIENVGKEMTSLKSIKWYQVLPDGTQRFLESIGVEQRGNNHVWYSRDPVAINPGEAKLLPLTFSMDYYDLPKILILKKNVFSLEFTRHPDIQITFNRITINEFCMVTDIIFLTQKRLFFKKLAKFWTDLRTKA